MRRTSFGVAFAQQAGDERVDHHALARPRRTGDQQVGHPREVDGLRLAGVAPERERQLGARRLEVELVEDPPQGDDVEVLVGDLDADRALAGIGASIRSERAARAIARSSARASMRLTLMSGAGWTSYWVTTGPRCGR